MDHIQINQPGRPRAKWVAEGPRIKIPASADRVEPEIEQLAHWMDSAFEIPGLGIRFGFDTILGLIPFLGDGISSLFSFYILNAAARHGVPRATLIRMGGNVAIDWLLGSVPLIGDMFDVVWKSNQMNVGLLRKHLAKPPAERRKSSASDMLFVGGIIVALLFVLAGVGLLTVVLLKATFGLLHGLFV